jgi:glycosyltransferase involved in cell wall biosynthesis
MTTSDVVHVITGLEVGGAEMLLLELCREDIRYGRTPSVASLMSDGPMRERFAEVGVQVIGLGMRRGNWSVPGLMKLVRIIRRKRPRIVQGWLYHGNLAATVATWASGVRPRPPVGWGILGTLPDFTCYPPRLRRAVRVSAKLSPFIDGILYNSRIALDAHQQFGFRSRRTHLVSNGIDLNKFRFDPISRAAVRRSWGLPDDAVVVIAVGRNDPMKNWEGVLSATDAVVDRNIWLVAVGEGTERLPPSRQRLLLGRRDDMPALYSAAEIFMLASYFGEGTSVALSEAMACGLPVIVTDVGDNGIVARDAGFVVPPRDAEALKAALLQLASDPLLRVRKGTEARAQAKSGFDAAVLHANIHSFHASLLDEQAEGGRQRS